MSGPSASSHKAARGRLWLALRLPELPLNALGFDADTPRALAITEKQQVVCSNAHARAMGIIPGTNATTARLLGDCELLPRDSLQEQQALAQLAERMYQFTPYIETYSNKTQAEAGLLLEVSRCLKLFAGLKPLAERIFASLQATPYCFECGLAHTAKGAWLLSYQQHALTGNEHKDLFLQRLQTVPVQWLHDYPQAVEALQKSGFHTLGDISRQIDAQTISSIKKRFGAPFTQAVCDIFAIEQSFLQSSLFEQPVAVYRPQEFFFDSLQFDYPVSLTEQLQWPIESMLQKLTQFLRKRQLQCQHIEWKLYDIHHNSEWLQVHCDSGQSHAQLLCELTRVQLEQRQLPFEVDTLELICRHTSPVQNRSQNLDFDGSHPQQRQTQNFAVTAARLKARLGERALFKIGYCDSHIPEASSLALATGEPVNQQLPEPQQQALRPTWLFDTPLPVQEQRQGLYWRGQLQILAGPERIEGNWWDTPTARDYFMAQRQDYLRVWIFHDLHKQQWFVQGVFG